MNQAESTSITERAKLLRTFREINLPDEYQLKIAKHIGSLEIPKREQRAKEINEKLRGCSSEEDMAKVVDVL